MKYPEYVYWKPNLEFISELTDYLSNKKVLEIFAGNGYLASLLKDKNIDIKATSILSGMDGHNIKLFDNVENIKASSAVSIYKNDYDVLMLCWPTTTEDAVKAILSWGPDKDIVFIGEYTDYSKHQLGGCATDLFFEITEDIHTFQSYKGNIYEKASVMRLKKDYLDTIIKKI
jgi:hypothetical protein